jgi:hypothetical protein
MRANDEGELHFFAVFAREGKITPPTPAQNALSLSIKNRNQFKIDQFCVLLQFQFTYKHRHHRERRSLGSAIGALVCVGAFRKADLRRTSECWTTLHSL